MKKKILTIVLLVVILVCGLFNQFRCLVDCWSAEYKDSCYDMCVWYYED